MQNNEYRYYSAPQWKKLRNYMAKDVDNGRVKNWGQ